MTLSVVFRSAARREFDGAALWYEKRQAGLGSQFVAEVTRAIEAASEHPQRFPVVHKDVRCIQIRRFPYSVFFREERGRLLVLGVFHGSRNPGVWRECA
jgi:toxin ParE1/3/4